MKLYNPTQIALSVEYVSPFHTATNNNSTKKHPKKDFQISNSHQHSSPHLVWNCRIQLFSFSAFWLFLHFVVKDSRTQLLLWSVGMKTRKRSKLFSSTGFLDSIYNNCAYRFWGGFGCNLSSHWFLGKKIVCFIFVFEATI